MIRRIGVWVSARLLYMLATKRDLAILEKVIMGAIKDYSDAVNTAFQGIGDSVDSFGKSLDGLTKDITQMKATIDKLQNSPGTISAEDQKLLDASQAQATALAEKAKTLAASFKALDDLTADDQLPTPPADSNPPATNG